MPSDQPLVERKLYTYAEVDRILALASGTAQRWINGYERRGVEYDPVVRARPLKISRVRWGEFIEVYYLSRFRASGIPLQKLRAILGAVRERTDSNYLFADDRVLYADSGELEVIYELQREEGVSAFLVKRTGQLRFELYPDARRRLERITYEAGVARALRPRIDLDHVIVYADKFFGKPKLEDTGVSPDAVARLVISGTPIETVSDLYGIEPSIINEAGLFSYGDRWKVAA